MFSSTYWGTNWGSWIIAESKPANIDEIMQSDKIGVSVKFLLKDIYRNLEQEKIRFAVLKKMYVYSNFLKILLLKSASTLEQWKY